MLLLKRAPYLVGIILLIYILKPSVFFKPNQKPRVYGLGYDEEGYKKTLFSMQFVIFLIAVLISMYIA